MYKNFLNVYLGNYLKNNISFSLSIKETVYLKIKIKICRHIIDENFRQIKVMMNIMRMF